MKHTAPVITSSVVLEISAIPCFPSKVHLKRFECSILTFFITKVARPSFLILPSYSGGIAELSLTVPFGYENCVNVILPL